MGSPKRVARLAGILYLIVALCGGFAQMYVRATIRVPGDAAATAGNIVAHASLFRLGFVADLVTATCSVLVAMTLYRLFKHVNKDAAAAMVVFMAIGTGMILVNLIFHFAALLVATDPSYATAGSDALVLLLVDMHWYGYVIGGIMFGLWLLPMGYLAYTSGMFPRALGVVLMVACFGYLIDTLTRFLLPSLGETLSTILTMPAAVAELWMVGYLLVVGVRTPATARPAPVTA
ncbi:DUF4386 domain-containing protein [Streptosporangium sp. NPDC051023]|uniref:DUF4386 domain-containing protein n=1 Tax=Streptosporangium sp. NPDC051023 TaxID=3155410 RepID=UPI0034501B78